MFASTWQFVSTGWGIVFVGILGLILGCVVLHAVVQTCRKKAPSPWDRLELHVDSAYPSWERRREEQHWNSTRSVSLSEWERWRRLRMPGVLIPMTPTSLGICAREIQKADTWTRRERMYGAIHPSEYTRTQPIVLVGKDTFEKRLVVPGLTRTFRLPVFSNIPSWHVCDTPIIDVEYREFILTEFKGGMWHYHETD